MAGHAGMAGIGLLAAYGEDALTKQYTQGFIRQAQQFLDTLSTVSYTHLMKQIKSLF